MSSATLDAVNQNFSQDKFNTYVMNTYGRFPLAIEKGEGCKLWDTDGKEYLDFVAGIATCTLGHGHPAMVKAVSQQIQKLHHISNFFTIYLNKENWLNGL